MKDKIRNSEIYNAISAVDAEAYLLSKGWRISERYKDKALIFADPLARYSITLPIKAFSDYALRMSELIAVLSQAEERDILAIVSEIKMSGYDVFKIRLMDDARDGSVPLEATKNILVEAREIMLSAADSTLQRRTVHHNKKSKEITSYIEKVRLGQTQEGSYVFTFLTPVSPTQADGPYLPFDSGVITEVDPFERQATTMLARALHATSRAETLARGTNDFVPFENAVSEGASANLFDALSQITKVSGNVDYSVTFSRARPTVVANAALENSVMFTPEKIELIEVAAKRFKAVAPQYNKKILGYVISLEKDKPDPNGNVGIMGMIDGEYKLVRLALSGQEYTIALQAHSNYSAIAVEGTLVKRGNFMVLEKITSFGLVP